MRLLLAGFFLFCLLNQAPAYAVTIVNVSEVSTILEKDYVSDCEWWETIETRTTTMYRDSVIVETNPVETPPHAFDPDFMFYSVEDLNTYPGVPNPCFPDSEDKDAVIPEYCNATLVGFVEGGGSLVGGGSSGPTLTFREWSEVSIHYNTVLRNQCHICDHDPTDAPIETTPEPQSLVFGLTGFVGLLFSWLRSHNKRLFPPCA